nr:co-chaperone GroES family protein [uncultured Flavobacterium sp.]
MKIINGNALVEIIKKETKLPSGIFVTEGVVDDEGIVIAIDPDVAHIVNVGDRVKFNPNNGHDMEYHGKKCKFLKAFDKDSPRTDIVFVYEKD